MQLKFAVPALALLMMLAGCVDNRDLVRGGVGLGVGCLVGEVVRDGACVEGAVLASGAAILGGRL